MIQPQVNIVESPQGVRPYQLSRIEDTGLEDSSNLTFGYVNI